MTGCYPPRLSQGNGRGGFVEPQEHEHPRYPSRRSLYPARRLERPSSPGSRAWTFRSRAGGTSERLGQGVGAIAARADRSAAPHYRSSPRADREGKSAGRLLVGRAFLGCLCDRRNLARSRPGRISGLCLRSADRTGDRASAGDRRLLLLSNDPRLSARGWDRHRHRGQSRYRPCHVSS